MILAFTGHRPPKIGGYNPNSPLRQAVKEALFNLIMHWGPDGVISGLALGVDQDAAWAAYQADIPFIGAAPCYGQQSKWPQPSQEEYRRLCYEASGQLLQEILAEHPSTTGEVSKDYSGVYYVHAGPYNDSCMQDRNKWMVYRADLICAVWDGSSGGTANCVRYAEHLNKEVLRIDPSNLL